MQQPGALRRVAVPLIEVGQGGGPGAGRVGNVMRLIITCWATAFHRAGTAVGAAQQPSFLVLAGLPRFPTDRSRDAGPRIRMTCGSVMTWGRGDTIWPVVELLGRGAPSGLPIGRGAGLHSFA